MLGLLPRTVQGWACCLARGEAELAGLASLDWVRLGVWDAARLGFTGLALVYCLSLAVMTSRENLQDSWGGARHALKKPVFVKVVFEGLP